MALPGVASEPEHNFVSLDLAWHAPPAANEKPVYMAVLVDTANIAKSGDSFEFDELQIGPANRFSETYTPNELPVQADTSRYHVSCGWRTMRGVSVQRLVPHMPPRSAMVQPDYFVRTSPFSVLIDKTCAGEPLHAGQGAKSVDEAVAAWRHYFEAGSVTNTITVQSTVYTTDKNALANDSAPHRFVPVASGDSSGNMLFLDRASIARDGDTVTAMSLVSVAPPQRKTYWAFLELRNVRYDCAQEVLTVSSSKSFYDDGTSLFDTSNRPAGKRTASESPVTAADIRAACADAPTAAPSFATIADAWAYARSFWPPFVRPTWIACAWNHLSDQQRAQYLSGWQSYSESSLKDGAALPPRLPWPDQATLDNCGIPNPWDTRVVIDAYAQQRGTLQILASNKIDEARLMGVWNRMPWPLQPQFESSASYANPQSAKLASDALNYMTKALGIDDRNLAARQQVEDYITAEARIERRT